MRKFFKWLYPGLGIKRWLLLFSLGGCLFVTGVVLLLGPGRVWQIGSFVHQLVRKIIGVSPVAGTGMLLLAGLIFMWLGGRNLANSIISLFLPREEGKVVDLLYSRRFLQRGPHIVAIGGGTGLSVILRGLKEYTSNITAVVNVCDDGGSSGRLRGDMGILPPGDIRNCLLALADTEPVMEKLFQHRFSKGELEGHSFGNLFIAAMTEMMGFKTAIKEFSKVLAVRGRVLPVTLNKVVLVAELANERQLRGQSAIAATTTPIKEVYLDPGNCRPLEEVLEAIARADAIILGPGSLFTSIIPNLLVPGVAQAIAAAPGVKYYVCNTKVQQGETSGFSALDHLRTIEKYLGEGVLNYFVVNQVEKTDGREKAGPAAGEPDEFLALDNMVRWNNIEILKGSLADPARPERHDPVALSKLIMENLLSAGRLLDSTRHYIAQLLYQENQAKKRGMSL
ncbi:MAG TPA: YvcK family protein [Firmicutes bacterium]|nr:YvcK family protein [Bacillota bacterium]